MRVMLKAQPDVAVGSQALRDGTLAEVIKHLSELTNAEALYVGPENGTRTMHMVFELNDSSMIPQITEPLFQKLNATVELLPVMNQQELKQSLQTLGASAAA